MIHGFQPFKHVRVKKSLALNKKKKKKKRVQVTDPNHVVIKTKGTFTSHE
jgi:hypothetical protein